MSVQFIAGNTDVNVGKVFAEKIIRLEDVIESMENLLVPVAGLSS